MTALILGVTLLVAGTANPTFNGLDLLGWALTIVGALWLLARASHRRSVR